MMMTWRRSAAAVLSAAAMIVLSGCEVARQAEDQVGQTEEIARQAYEEVTPRERGPQRLRRHKDGFWVGTGRGVVPDDAGRLPAELDKTFISATLGREDNTLRQLLQDVTAQTGLPVRLQGESCPGVEGEQGVAAQQAAQGGAPPIPPPPGAEREGQGLSMDYQGSLSAYLDMLGAHFGVDWRYDREAEAVLVQGCESMVVRIAAMPMSSEMQGQLSGGTDTGDGGGVGASTQQTTSQISVAVWEDIEETLETILGDQGQAGLSPATGTVVLQGRPRVVRMARDYLEELNNLQTQVWSIGVNVYTVTREERENYGVDLSFVLDRAADWGTITLAGPQAPAVEGAGSLGWAILDPPAGSGTEDFDGSQVLVEALSQRNDVSRVYGTTVLARHGVPTPVSRALITDYVERTTTTTTPDVGVQVSREPATAVTGLQLTLVPIGLNDGRVLLDYALDISDLIDLETAGTADDFIQLRRIASLATRQSVALRPGSTLVLVGMMQQGASKDERGIGATWNWATGGRDASVDSVTVIITMTPEEV